MNLFKNNLYIVSTPIGNLEDITFRAVEVLKKSDIILCEDTRHSLKLLNHLKIKKKLISYHKFNERKKILPIIEHIKQGKILSLISDAGTPLLSDPGKILINECIKKNINISPIPGASSITAAASISGFKDEFLFNGFLPKKAQELESVLTKLSILDFTQIFFVPALKVNFYLKSFKKFFSGREIVIAKEITKLHEEIIREKVDSIKLFTKPLKGELTIIISDKKVVEKVDRGKIISLAKKYLKKYSLKDTVKIILKTEKISKKDVYTLCLKIKNEKTN